MKRLFNKISILLTIVLLLGAIPVAAVERPFALNGTGVGVFTFDADGFPTSAAVTGSGTATHLGLWTVSGIVTYTRDNGVIRSHVETTIIAANGDHLNAVANGILDLGAGGDSGTFTFNGGTGRFAGASGSADFVVAVNAVTGGFELTMVGRIDY